MSKGYVSGILGGGGGGGGGGDDMNNNAGNISLEWSANFPESGASFDATLGRTKQIPLNGSYTVNTDITSYPNLATDTAGGTDLIDPSTFEIKELLVGQSATLTVEIEYIDKSQNNNFWLTIALVSTNPAIPRQVKQLITSQFPTTYIASVDFTVTAADLAQGYQLFAEVNLNDLSLNVRVRSITMTYHAVENYT